VERKQLRLYVRQLGKIFHRQADKDEEFGMYWANSTCVALHLSELVKKWLAYHFTNHKYRYIRGFHASKFFAVPQNWCQRLEIQAVNIAYEAKRATIFMHL
jgi:hypothetical protein